MLNISKLYIVYEKKDQHGKPVPFDLKFIKKSTGAIVEAKDVVCLSSNKLRKSINVQFPNKQIRTIKLITIIEINGTETYI